ncbi:hypothetical protein GCM10027425_15610 [Alteromonas gracilis]
MSGLRGDLGRRVSANLVVRVVAVLAVAVATVVVARAGGAADVGGYALLRILPGLLGVLAVCGLPGALAWFLAAPRRGRPGLWPSLLAIALAGALAGTIVWAALSPVLAAVFLTGDAVPVVLLAGVTVGSQLYLTLGKTALQGLEDAPGADRVIAAEELAFLPGYGLALLAGLAGTPALVVGLAGADLVVGWYAWRRVGRTWRARTGSPLGGALRGRPDPAQVREIVGFGWRGQIGGLVTLLNLRLDFAILGALAGPAVLGVYAVASKFAELLRLPGTALTWVTYPRLAGLPAEEADRLARRMLWPAAAVVVAAAVPTYALIGPVVRLLYGAEFEDAIGLARLLVVGMLLAGAAGVASGWLYGRGRPGRNSVALGVGLVLTVVLDLALIPAYGAWGAAVASTVAYVAADAVLVGMLLRGGRVAPRPVGEPR